MTIEYFLEWFIVLPIAYLLLAFFITFKIAHHFEGTKFEKPIFLLFVVPFFIFDWAVNWTTMTILCLELPETVFEVVTKRMQRYKREINPRGIRLWRYRVAVFLCYLANTVDREHC